MIANVIVFPGSNCDRDVAVAIESATGAVPRMVWHRETELPPCDLIVLPGGFSYGDYLRSGAMAAHSPIMRAVVDRARAGVAVLGTCNGFQVLTEAGLLPGVLMRNASLKFCCKDAKVKVEHNDTIFTSRYEVGQPAIMPIAHKDGNYFADDETLARLEGEGLVAFRYCNDDGEPTEEANPNGSRHNIAGLYDKTRRILGLMPHPERSADPVLGPTDGRELFRSLAQALQ
jgi:phosphoribosylformylglycinamidine synthase subunit PurQ / glutaminase